MMNRWLVFSDMDGTLLDHHSYSHAAADSTLAKLAASGIPVIPCTSKTRSEVLEIRHELGNSDPFIVENGAAVILPEGCFDNAPPDTNAEPGFWVKHFVPPREHWLQVLAGLDASFKALYRGFSDMDTNEICELTGLDPDSARRAAQREYGEPIHWRGSAEQQQAFISAVEAAGARVLKGGRFLHVSGATDKGQALRWLAQAYQSQTGPEVGTIALGDSHNDVAMLEAADWALIVRSPAHPPPQLTRTDRVRISENHGPAGWAQLVQGVLPELFNTRE